MKVGILACARCGDDHRDLRFAELINPTDEWKFWASCPTTKQPILMRVETVEDAAAHI